MTDPKLKTIREITDTHQYLAAVSDINIKLVAISVKDTFGNFINDELNNLLSGIGIKSNLVRLLWLGYVALLDNNDVIYEHLADEQNVPVEYETEHEGINVKLISRPLRCGNQAEIFIDGFDYSVNRRGLNIVIFDKDSGQVVDLVCFDTHVKECTCIRKITTC